MGGLIVCAGIQQAIDYPVDYFRMVLNVDVTGNFLMAKHMTWLIREAMNTGSVVLISSTSKQIVNQVG